MAVHDVDVEGIRTGGFRRLHILCQTGKSAARMEAQSSNIFSLQLGYPATVAFLLRKRRVQEDVHDLQRQAGTGDQRPQSQHIGVVVLPGGPGGEAIPAQGTADAGTLLGGKEMPMPVLQMTMPLSFASCQRTATALP